jgi:hypothetical protein
MSDPTASAFPWVSNGGVHEHQVVEGGLTKREYFAAMLMQGITSNATTRSNPQDIAQASVAAADALLAELAK